jgi:hypothetical protein
MILNASIKIEGADPARLFTGHPKGPYPSLDLAILRAAILEVSQTIRNQKCEDAMTEAAIWLWDPALPVYSYSLDDLCERLGLSPNYLRELVWFEKCTPERRKRIKAALPGRLVYPTKAEAKPTPLRPAKRETLDEYIERKRRELVSTCGEQKTSVLF